MWVDNRFIASDKLPRAINKSQFRNQLHIKYRLLEFSVLAIIDVYTLKLYNFSMIEQKTKFSRVNKSLAFWVNNTIFSIWKKKVWDENRHAWESNEMKFQAQISASQIDTPTKPLEIFAQPSLWLTIWFRVTLSQTKHSRRVPRTSQSNYVHNVCRHQCVQTILNHYKSQWL